jgi:hypothetical protein
MHTTFRYTLVLRLPTYMHNYYYRLFHYFCYSIMLDTTSEWSGLPDFSLYNITKRGKCDQISKKYTKCFFLNIPLGIKIDRMSSKYTNIIHCKAVQNLRKLGFLVWKYSIWQPCEGLVCSSPYLQQWQHIRKHRSPGRWWRPLCTFRSRWAEHWWFQWWWCRRCGWSGTWPDQAPCLPSATWSGANVMVIILGDFRPFWAKNWRSS